MAANILSLLNKFLTFLSSNAKYEFRLTSKVRNYDVWVKVIILFYLGTNKIIQEVFLDVVTQFWSCDSVIYFSFPPVEAFDIICHHPKRLLIDLSSWCFLLLGLSFILCSLGSGIRSNCFLSSQCLGVESTLVQNFKTLACSFHRRHFSRDLREVSSDKDN